MELAFAIKELDVDAVPLNFLNPIAGTPLENAEITFMAKDGRRVEVDGNVNCYMENDKPKYVQCIFRDVTERKRMEEELRKTSLV